MFSVYHAQFIISTQGIDISNLIVMLHSMMIHCFLTHKAVCEHFKLLFTQREHTFTTTI